MLPIRSLQLNGQKIENGVSLPARKVTRFVGLDLSQSQTFRLSLDDMCPKEIQISGLCFSLNNNNALIRIRIPTFLDSFEMFVLDGSSGSNSTPVWTTQFNLGNEHTVMVANQSTGVNYNTGILTFAIHFFY